MRTQPGASESCLAPGLPSLGPIDKRLYIVFSILRYIVSHPLTRNRPFAAIARFARYQFLTRMRKTARIKWFAGAQLVVQRNMPGASGNIYCGLHEFPDMAFFLHFLRPDDLFLDIGANVGTYTVLASRICKARTIAFEPDSGTAAKLRRNVAANGIEDKVSVAELALSDRQGTISFSVGLDTINHIMADGAGKRVATERLDDFLGARSPVAMKMDVESGEPLVVAGAVRTLASPKLQAIETEDVSPPVIEAIRNAGFQRAYYDPFSRRLSREPNGLDSNNALFIRDWDRCQQRLTDAPRRRLLTGQIL